MSEDTYKEKLRRIWGMWGSDTMDGIHPMMRCPFCDDNNTYVHIGESEVFQGGNYEANEVFDIGVRGSVFVQHCYCESEYEWVLVLGEHKGNVYCDCVLIQDKEDQIAFDSPIEAMFWEAWLRVNEPLPAGETPKFVLVPQYPNGKYRVGFAHVETKTVIELDGFASHSSTDDIARDRKRQREIEEQGWHVIRFGGKETYHGASRCAMEVWLLLERRSQSRFEHGGKS